MKRLLIFLLLAVLSVGCSPLHQSDGTQPAATKTQHTYYFAEGYDAVAVAPYVILSSDNTFRMGDGLITSYTEYGTVTVDGNTLAAVTQNGNASFRVVNKTTLILTHDMTPLSFPIGTVFTVREEW